MTPNYSDIGGPSKSGDHGGYGDYVGTPYIVMYYKNFPKVGTILMIHIDDTSVEAGW